MEGEREWDGERWLLEVEKEEERRRLSNYLLSSLLSPFFLFIRSESVIVLKMGWGESDGEGINGLGPKME